LTGVLVALDLERERQELRVPGLSAALVAHEALAATVVAGLADTDRGTPVTPQTAFTWASVSKTVTATALMQLHERGLFALDDDVGEYLPFPVRIPAFPDRRVTFRQLLVHTSAIRDSSIYDSLYVVGDSPIPLGEFLADYLVPGGRYYDRKRNFRSRCPGTVSEYSNIGAGVLGYLVEVLSGERFDRYAADHIFAPLGMANTSFTLTGLDLDLVARPGGNGPLQSFPTYPDGTLRSPPAELAKFLVAYLRGGSYEGRHILRPATVDAMLCKQTPLDPDQGLIWYRQKFGKRLWGHVGDDPGISANMFLHRKSRTGVLLAANGRWKKDADRTMRRLLRHARSL
jgi:CubicO group peptidase (beta-lactamase class C family)